MVGGAYVGPGRSERRSLCSARSTLGFGHAEEAIPYNGQRGGAGWIVEGVHHGIDNYDRATFHVHDIVRQPCARAAGGSNSRTLE